MVKNSKIKKSSSRVENLSTLGSELGNNLYFSLPASKVAFKGLKKCYTTRKVS